MGAPPPGRCDPYFYSPTAYGFPPSTPADHSVQIGLTLDAGAQGLPSPQYAYVTVYNGAVNAASCPSMDSEISAIHRVPTGKGGILDNWLVMGPHTVLEADAGGAELFWVTQRSPVRNPDIFGFNPLYAQPNANDRVFDLWDSSGEFVIRDAWDFIREFGSCNWGCDISGYTVENTQLVEATPESIPFLYAENTTFRNMSFQTGSQWDYADFRNAVFDGVTMNSVTFKGADFSGARFTGNTTLTNVTVLDTNFSAASFGPSTQMRGLRVTGDGSSECTSFAGTNLLAGVFDLASVSLPPTCTTTLFGGASVRPIIASLSLWPHVKWTGANIIWDASDRTYLHGADLSGIDLSGARMSGVPADLENTNFSGAKLGGTSLAGVDLAGATLSGANAQRAVFDGANLSNARLNQPQGTTTVFNYASFQNALLDNASFANSSMLGANFSHARADGATNFGNTRAAGVIFDGAHILNNPAAFEGAVFDPDPSTSTGDVSFIGAVMGGNVAAGGGLNFSQAHLRNAHFNFAQCIGCIFAATDLTGANFSQAYLAGARFNSATLTNATLGGALLSTTSGTWIFQLGVAEPPSSIAYAATDFTGTSLSNVGSCPDSSVPNGNANGCNGHTNANPSPPLPPACSAAGQDTCPLPVSTSVGTGTAGSSANQVSNPTGIVVARNGDVYFADTGNHVVRRVSGSAVTTIAGQMGMSGESGDGGSATSALLQAPVGLALGVEDPPTVYIADRDANRVRKVAQTFDGSGNLHSIISTVAGNGQRCSDPVNGTCGDGDNQQQALFAELSAPEAVWADPLGNVYIADTQANKIRVATNSGAMHLVAGTGVSGYGGDGGKAVSAMLSAPAGLASDIYGNLYVADTNNNRVRKIDTSGTIATVFGTGTAGYNGSYAQDPVTFNWTYPKPGTAAQLNHPRGLAVNTSTGLYVADTGNGIVRRLNTASGAIALVAGKTKESGNSSTVDTSFNGDGLPANQTGFNQPNAVAITAGGAFRVTDAGHQRVRSFGPASAGP